MTADPDRLAAAWAALAHLGVTLDDLRHDARPRRPTFNDYLPRVVVAAGPGARRVYGSYWRQMARTWAGRPLDDTAASEIQARRLIAVNSARSRRNSRGGRYAGELFIAAARAYFNQAIADGLIDRPDSPVHRIRKPRRLPSTRRALTPDELTDINAVARTTGNDPVLDALLLRLHTETACRRGGALGLRP